VTFRTPYLDNDLVKLAFRAPLTARQSPRSALKLISNSGLSLGRIPTDRGLVWNASRATEAVRKLFCEVTFKLDYLHHEGLPHFLSPIDQLVGAVSKTGLLNLHKFLPYRKWFREDLSKYAADRVAAARSQGLPYWDRKVLETIVSDHIRGTRNHLREINAILTLEATARLLLRGPAVSDSPVTNFF
jgi:asparagine synthase (glutamine-hydrolysing)